MPGLKHWAGERMRMGELSKERLEEFEAIGPPGPGAQGAKLAAVERGGGRLRWRSKFDELGRGEAGLCQAAEKLDRGPLFNEHDVAGPAKELGQAGEVPGEGGLVFDRGEGFSLGDAAFGQGVEPEDGWERGTWTFALNHKNKSAETPKLARSARTCSTVSFRSPRRIIAPRVRCAPNRRERSAPPILCSSSKCHKASRPVTLGADTRPCPVL